MMGIKERRFEPLPRAISLEDLVPKDNFCRQLEATLDLSFVREMGAPCTLVEVDLLWIRWSSS